MSDKRSNYEETLEQVRPLIDPMYWKQFQHYAMTGEMPGRLMLYLQDDPRAQRACDILDQAAMMDLELLAMDAPETEN